MSEMVRDSAESPVGTDATGLESTIAERLRTLPVARQLQVQDFVEFLQQEVATHAPRDSSSGLEADRGVDLTEDDIDDARREMWTTGWLREPDHRKQLLDFARYLAERESPRRARRGMMGICEEPGADITEEEIDQARREMWGTFPRLHLLEDEQ